MPLSFRQSAPGDRAAIVRFLASVFHSSLDAPYLDERLLDWKYFCPHPLWSGSRSYVLEQDGRIVAHGCVYPVSLAEDIRAVRVIDWAGSSAVPGSGVLLMRKLAALADVVLAPGGSQDTKAVLPKTGFRNAGRLERYALVVRPWLHLRANPRRDWKTPARFARNALNRIGRLRPAPAGWSAERTASLDDGRLDYLLTCPGARAAAYTLKRGGEKRGWFMLSHVLGQTRIAAVQCPEDPDAGWALAVRTAAEDSETIEVMTAAAPSANVLEAGLRRRGGDEVLIYDPKKLVSGPVRLSLLDGDEWFLANPRDPFT